MFLLSSADFFKHLFSKTSFRNTIRISKGLDTDQDRRFISSDLGTNCLQTLSVDEAWNELLCKACFIFKLVCYFFGRCSVRLLNASDSLSI